MQLQTIYRNWFSKLCLLLSYDDLEELFIYLWWKIHRDGNTLRLIKWKLFQWEFLRDYTDNLWKKLRDDYLDYFGVSDGYKKYLILLARFQDHKSKFARTGNRWHIGQIIGLELELDALENQKPRDEYDTLLDVQMTLGGLKIDPKQASVIEYGSSENKAIEIAKNQRSANNARKNKRK